MPAGVTRPLDFVGRWLCESCRRIDTRRPFCGPETSRSSFGKVTRICYSHAYSLHQLLTSALEKECALCHLILDAIRNHYVLISNQKNILDDWDYLDDLDDFGDPNDDDHADVSEDSENDSHFFIETETGFDAVNSLDSPILLDFTFRDPRRDELPSRCIDITVHWTQTEDLTRLWEARDLRNDFSTKSDYSSELARNWLKKCNTEHELCRQRKKQREVLPPTRVIDVAGRGDVRLVEARQVQTAEYACLSHFWGKSQPFKTDKASLSDRMLGMGFEAMPLTFQDAITITRNLGIQYLWIDSLCIVQDSAEDWAFESANMGKIYRDATITIFAEHADSDDGGCFSTRPGRSSALCRTPMFDSLIHVLGSRAYADSSTFVQAKLHHAGGHSLPDRHSIFETIKTLNRSTIPLNSRAWVLQESILRHRALYFDKDEVRWSCPSMKACECIPEGHIRQSWSALDQGDAELIDARELTNAWVTIVHEFSSRNLTYNKDKLPALAGIASEMSRYKRSSYLAGVWKNDLRLNLAWSVFPRNVGAPYHETKRILNSGTPSWSWANIQGEVRMLSHHDDINPSHDTTNERSIRANNLLCTILNCTATPISKLNPFGEVQSGILTLHERLGNAKCCTPVTTSYHIGRIPLQDSISNLQTAWFDPDEAPIPADNAISEIWSIPLYNDGSRLICLALRPVSADRVRSVLRDYPEAQGQIFERVGIVTPKTVMSSAEIAAEPEKCFPTAIEQNNALFAWFERCEVSVITVV